MGKRSEGSFFLHKGPWLVIFSRVRNFSFLRYSYCSYILRSSKSGLACLAQGKPSDFFWGCFSLVCCQFERLARLRSNVQAAAHCTLQVLKNFYPVFERILNMEISLQKLFRFTRNYYWKSNLALTSPHFKLKSVLLHNWRQKPSFFGDKTFNNDQKCLDTGLETQNGK